MKWLRQIGLVYLVSDIADKQTACRQSCRPARRRATHLSKLMEKKRTWGSKPVLMHSSRTRWSGQH